MRGHQPAAGMTLLEMLLVLVLIAAAMLLAMTAFSGSLRGMQLHQAAREVAAQLRFTRALAIRTGQPQEFVLDVRQRRWRAPEGRRGQLPDVGVLRFRGAGGQQLLGAQHAELGVVRFFPDGAATGGQLRLEAAGAGWQVEVGWLTGEVRLQRIGEGR